MENKAPVQIKDVVRLFDCLDRVVIWQFDTYLDPEKNKEEDGEIIFDGGIMDIPWIYLDYYFTEHECEGPIMSRDFGPEVPAHLRHGYVWFTVQRKENIECTE